MPATTGQFLINFFTSGDQDDVSMVGLANGQFVAVLQLQGRIELFNADGSRAGGRLAELIGTAHPDVAAAPDGTFFVASTQSISRFDSDLNNVTITGVANSLGGSDVGMAVRSDGGRFTAFTSGSTGPTDPNIRGNFFIDGHPIAANSANSFINSSLPGLDINPDVAALGNGRFVTVWEKTSGVQTGAVFFRFTDVTFGPDPDFPAQNPNASIVTHGTETNVTFGANGSHPAVAALPGNRFVVLWYDDFFNENIPFRINGRIYDSNGNAAGFGLGDFVVTTTADQGTFLNSNRDIAVTALPDGKFVVAWTGFAGTGVDNSGTYIDAALFDSAFTPSPGDNASNFSSPFRPLFSMAKQFNESLTGISGGNQFDPSLAALADGRFVLGWTDDDSSRRVGGGTAGDTGLDVRGRIFDLRTAAININGTPGNDQYIGTDVVTNGLGNDTFNTGAGNDTIDGRAGTDSARFAGQSSAYTIQNLGNGTVIVTGPDGTDTLTSIERLIFDDTTITVNVNQAPVITFGGGGNTATISLPENQLAVANISAFDADLDQLQYSFAGGADANRFSINSVSGALRFLVAPDFENPTDADGNRSYIVTVRVTAGGQTDTQTITVNITDQVREVAVPLDFNGEGTSDILLRRTDGTFSLDLIDNLGLQSGSSVGHVGNEWHVVGIGNFDNDRDADLLVQRDDGTLQFFGFEAGKVKSAAFVGQVGNEWRTTGIGDFDGDGDRDLLMQRGDGTLQLFGFEAGQVKSAAFVGQVGNEWRTIGIGDFDGDGDSDLLMQRGDGTLQLFGFGAGQVKYAAFVGSVGSEWHTAGIGDFDGDGDSDLLMRRDDGFLQLFGFEAGQVKSAVILGHVGTDWHTASVGNYDGDNDFDLLLRRDDGTLQIYEFEGGRVQSAVVLGPVGLEWSVI